VSICRVSTCGRDALYCAKHSDEQEFLRAEVRRERDEETCLVCAQRVEDKAI
jgi:hypothetical protein